MILMDKNAIRCGALILAFPWRLIYSYLSFFSQATLTKKNIVIALLKNLGGFASLREPFSFWIFRIRLCVFERIFEEDAVGRFSGS